MNKAQEFLNEMMQKGIISKNNSIGGEQKLDLGFVTVGKEKVAFTPKTDYGKQKISDFKVGDKVKVEVEDSPRGKHAKKMSR